MSKLSQLSLRMRNRGQRLASESFGRTPVKLHNREPLISFSFDDYPRSALHVGGTVLEEAGVRGTYYVALSLMDTEIPAGPAFTLDDLLATVERGHELGCHTYAHCHAWSTDARTFEASVIENACVLQRHLPGRKFTSLSYPIAWPRPGTKRRVLGHVHCCRGGGETFNCGTVDAAHLQASFLEKHQHELDWVKRLIDASVQARGWLVLATHDVGNAPTRLGCETTFFKSVVRHAVASGAKVLSVGEAWAFSQREAK